MIKFITLAEQIFGDDDPKTVVDRWCDRWPSKFARPTRHQQLLEKLYWREGVVWSRTNSSEFRDLYQRSWRDPGVYQTLLDEYNAMMEERRRLQRIEAAKRKQEALAKQNKDTK